LDPRCASLLALAINNARSTDPDAVRKAIVGIRRYIGAEGVYNFDESGEGVRGYNVVRNDNGKIVFITRADFDR
jgi:branched-chain amino acid transport system substrate-binding protein